MWNNNKINGGIIKYYFKSNNKLNRKLETYTQKIEKLEGCLG